MLKIFNAFREVIVSIYALIKAIFTETVGKVVRFYRYHPIIAAYITGFVVACATAIIGFNYGVNSNKTLFDSNNHHSSTEATETTRTDGESLSEVIAMDQPEAQSITYTEDDSPENEDILTPEAEAKIEAKGLKGIDVSQHNPPNEWQDKLDDIDFVIVKISEGHTYLDPCFKENMQAAMDAEKLVGVYHLVRPDSGVKAVKEAKFFVQELKEAGWDHDWLLACDFEPQYSIRKSDGSIDYAANTKFCKKFLDEVTRLTSVKPLMYACARDINNGGDNWKEIAKSYGLWMAGYPENSNTENINFIDSDELMPYKTGAWSYVTIWQYSSSRGQLDKDVAYMTEEAWSRFAKPTSN